MQPFEIEGYYPQEKFVHETAIVDLPCEIGLGTRILTYAHVMANALIGQNCLISDHVTISSGVMLGNNVKLMPYTHLMSGVILENDVYCGARAVFEPLKTIRAGRNNVSSIQPSLVKRGATIGPNATIASGFIIGKFAFIEGASVVDTNIPDYAVCHGDPIEIIGWRCECGSLLKFIFEQTSCQACGSKYYQASKREIKSIT